MTLSRGTIISFVVFHLFCISGEASYYALDYPGYQRVERDRRLCRFEPPPDWCFVPEDHGRHAVPGFRPVRPGRWTTPAICRGWSARDGGPGRCLNRLLFMDYDIFDARGPMGLIGVALRWIALASIAAAIVGIVIGILTRR